MYEHPDVITGTTGRRNLTLGTPVIHYWDDPHGNEPVASAAIVLAVYDHEQIDVVRWTWDRGANNYLEQFDHLLPHGRPVEVTLNMSWWDWPTGKER